MFSFVSTRIQKCVDACVFIMLWMLSAAFSKAPPAEASRFFELGLWVSGLLLENIPTLVLYMFEIQASGSSSMVNDG